MLTKLFGSKFFDSKIKSANTQNSERWRGYFFDPCLAPDKLYASYLVYEAPGVVLTMLNKDQPYYFTVDSFGEGGIAEGALQRL